MAGHYRIVEWDEYQHYRDRSPPWIKLHRNLLTSRTWVSLDDHGRTLAIACMLIAADTGNKIPDDACYIRRRAYLDEDPDFAALLAVGFIEHCNDSDVPDASAVLADARPEERRGEGEKSREEQKQTSGVASASPAPIAPHVKRSPLASRLPADFVVPDGWKQSAAEARERHGLPAINLDLEAEKFVDYWTAKAGQAATKMDWRKTFVNWCRNASAPRNPNGTGPPKPEGFATVTADLMAKYGDT